MIGYHDWFLCNELTHQGVDLGEGEDGDVDSDEERVTTAHDGEDLRPVVSWNIEHITILLIRSIRTVNSQITSEKILELSKIFHYWYQKIFHYCFQKYFIISFENILFLLLKNISYLCCISRHVPSLQVKDVTPSSEIQSVRVNLTNMNILSSYSSVMM